MYAERCIFMEILRSTFMHSSTHTCMPSANKAVFTVLALDRGRRGTIIFTARSRRSHAVCTVHNQYCHICVHLSTLQTKSYTLFLTLATFSSSESECVFLLGSALPLGSALLLAVLSSLCWPFRICRICFNKPSVSSIAWRPGHK